MSGCRTPAVSAAPPVARQRAASSAHSVALDALSSMTPPPTPVERLRMRLRGLRPPPAREPDVVPGAGGPGGWTTPGSGGQGL